MKKYILLVLLQLPMLLNAQISILKKFQGSGNTYVHSLMKYNNQLYFYADDATLGTGLWKTDGTEAGTVFVKATGMIHTYGEVASQPVISGGLLYFSVNNINSQLWRTDGTPEGTFQVAESFMPAIDFNKIDFNGILVFVNIDADGDELWRSDGTVAGTYKITDFYAGSGSGIRGTTMAKQGNYIYFAGGPNQTIGTSVLCRTDGTAAGTQVVANSGYSVSNLAVVGDKIVYSAQIDYTVICVGQDNYRLSTRKIMKVENGICSVLINPVTYHEGVYPNGTYCTYFGSEFGDSYYFRKSGNRLFFKARNYPVSGGSYYTSTETLCTTDGNTSQVLKVFPSTTLDGYGNNEAINNKDFNRGEYNETSISESVFYFSAGDNTTGFELWRSDGTISGTYLLKDINSGSGSSFPTSFKTIGNTTYFYAAYNGSNSKLFKTDGTATGTIEVTDPNLVLSYPLVNASNSKYSNNIGNKYIFVGKPSDNSGTALFSVCTIPIAPLVTSSVGSSICTGSSTTLTATGCSGTVNWSTGTTTSSITVSPTVNTTYTATCTDVCGVSPSGSFPITVNPLPTIPSISQTGTKIICPRASFSLSASGCNGSTITWSNNTVGSSITVNSANTYTATCTNVCGTSTASSPLIVLEAANTQTLSGIAYAGLSHGSQSISSTQTINSTLNVAYQAGNNITLNTDFISDLGSTFNAEIGSACPITDGLVASYNMDNNVNDQSGNGHNTTFTNTTVTTGRKGNVNGAYSFNGVNQRINLGGWFNMQEFTISMWVNASPTQNNAYAMIVDNNHGGNISWNSQQDNLNTNQYSFGVSGSSGGGGGYSLTSNKWEHIVLVKGNGFVKVYKNGEYLSGSSHSGLINYTSTVPSLCLGAYVNNGNYVRYWAGKMDDIKIYNRAISAVEVGYLYAE